MCKYLLGVHSWFCHDYWRAVCISAWMTEEQPTQLQEGRCGRKDRKRGWTARTCTFQFFKKQELPRKLALTFYSLSNHYFRIFHHDFFHFIYILLYVFPLRILPFFWLLAWNPVSNEYFLICYWCIYWKAIDLTSNIKLNFPTKYHWVYIDSILFS